MGRILVVEDDEAVRSFTARALKADGHDVATAADGAAGLDHVLDTTSSFDLVLSDIRMPVMDGIEMAVRICASCPGQKVLLMTGYAHMRERGVELAGTVVGVIEKPFTLKQIRDAVKEAIAA
jgi:CheY-like chemotaxis protein